jgi:hypothetical protein
MLNSPWISSIYQDSKRGETIYSQALIQDELEYSFIALFVGGSLCMAALLPTLHCIACSSSS